MPSYIIPTTFVAIDRMTGTMARIERRMVGMNTIAGASGAKLQRSLQATSAAAMDLAMSAAMIGAAVVIPLGLAAHAATKFEKSMTNIATLVDTTKESMKDMGDAVLGVASKVPAKIDDLTEALYQIRSAGISAAKAMNVLEQSGKLGVAGLGTTVEAANMITSAMNVFKRESLDANTAADVLFKTVQGGKTKVAWLAEGFGKAALAASDVGVSFRELMAMTAAFTNTGVQTAEAQTGITQALISLNKRTELMIGIQEKLTGKKGITGIEFTQWAGSGVEAMKKIDDYATKNRMDLFKVYGRKEGALADIALTRLQNKTYNDLYKTMQDVNAINAAYQKELGTTAAQAQIAKNKLVTLGIRIGDLLLPALTKIAQVLGDVVGWLADFAEKHKIITGLVVGGVAVFGALAVTVGAVALVVGTVTKAYWLFNGALVAWNFVAGVSSVLTGSLAMNGGLLNRQLAILPGFASGATLAMNGFAASTKTAFIWMLAAFGVYKLVMAEMDKRKSEKEKNPLGFDYYGTANSKKNANIEKKWGISESDFNAAKAVYMRSMDKEVEGPGKYRNMFGYVVTSPIHGNGKHDEDSGHTQAIDSTDYKSFLQLQQGGTGGSNTTDTTINLNVNVDQNGNATVNGKPVNGPLKLKVTPTNKLT